MPNPSKALHGRKQDFVRGEIWNAAVDLFARKGYDRTTVEDIAAASGVSRRTFFRYFASKDDLMVKAIDFYGDLLVTAIRSVAPEASPLVIVRHAVGRVVDVVLAQPRVRDSMTISMTSPAARRAQLAELEIVTNRLAAECARRLGRRARNVYTADVMASLIMSTLTLTFRVWYEREPANIHTTVDGILESAIGLLDDGRPRSDRRARRAARGPLPEGRRARHPTSG